MAAGTIQPGQKVLVIRPEKDNVATVIEDLAAGEVLEVNVGDHTIPVRVEDAIPFGHKVAVRAIAAGEPVMKYGEQIGLAVKTIRPGQHVHVHNVESTRARGDREGDKTVE